MNFTFATVDVKTELVKLLKAELARQNHTQVHVLRADPATPAELPCIGINRVTDDETNESIGDLLGESYERSTHEFRTHKGAYFKESIEIRIWHTNADKRDELYQVVKATLFASHSKLVEKGLVEFTLRGGRDEQDTTMQNAPAPLYWSSITLDVTNPLNVDIIEEVAPITSITETTTLIP